MYSKITEKIKSFYPAYVLLMLSLAYIVGELGHYLIGATSKDIARVLHYGDKACQLNVTELAVADLPQPCDSVKDLESCANLTLNGTPYCEWDYNGLGIDYQILAGPSFIFVFSVAGVFFGVFADKCNRVRMLVICTVIFSLAIVLMGAVKEYWHLVLLRMILAAGEACVNPVATGMLSDLFAEDKRALVMSVFNWGIYGGYGIAFPVGRYVPLANAWDLGWRVCYYGAGIVGVIIAIVTALTVKEPERKAIGEETTNKDGSKKETKESERDWWVLLQPRVVLLCIAAAIRHTGGMCFAYNADLFYREYFPDYDLGWWLFGVTIVIGGIGVVAGGIISDIYVAKMGIRSRVAVLALSQLIATPFAFGSVYLEPVGAMVTLGVSYFFAEMWFGIVFAVVVEIVPLAMRSTTVGIFLFVINNIGGNLPIAVEPVRLSSDFRSAMAIFYAGFYLISSVMFFLTIFVMEVKPSGAKNPQDFGHENGGLQIDTLDTISNAPTLTLRTPNGKNPDMSRL